MTTRHDFASLDVAWACGKDNDRPELHGVQVHPDGTVVATTGHYAVTVDPRSQYENKLPPAGPEVYPQPFIEQAARMAKAVNGVTLEQRDDCIATEDHEQTDIALKPAVYHHPVGDRHNFPDVAKAVRSIEEATFAVLLKADHLAKAMAHAKRVGTGANGYIRLILFSPGEAEQYTDGIVIQVPLGDGRYSTIYLMPARDDDHTWEPVIQMGRAPMRTCQVCGMSGPDECFVRDASAPDGYRNKCRACRAAEKRAARVK